MGFMSVVPFLFGLAVMLLAVMQVDVSQARTMGHERLARFDIIAERAAARNLETLGAGIQATAWANAAAPVLTAATLPAMGAVSVCATGTQCGLTATATYAVDGATSAGGATDQVLAPNVERNAAEVRVAMTITTNLLDQNGNVLYSRPHRVKLRLYGNGGSEVDGTQDSAGKDSGFVEGAAEDEGCAPDGTGCDPAAPTLPDPTDVDALTACAQGAGSGTCAAPSTVTDNKVNTTFSNGQYVAPSGP
jgi:hypothetical protein